MPQFSFQCVCDKAYCDGDCLSANKIDKDEDKNDDDFDISDSRLYKLIRSMFVDENEVGSPFMDAELTKLFSLAGIDAVTFKCFINDDDIVTYQYKQKSTFKTFNIYTITRKIYKMS